MIITQDTPTALSARAARPVQCRYIWSSVVLVPDTSINTFSFLIIFIVILHHPVREEVPHLLIRSLNFTAMTGSWMYHTPNYCRLREYTNVVAACRHSIV